MKKSYEMTADEEFLGTAAQQKRFTVLGVEFAYLYLFGIGTAMLGWIAENVVRMITVGVFDCRFHLLPFISPYALIPFAFHILLGDPDAVTVFGCKIFRRQTKKSKVASNFICLGLILGAVFAGELVIGNLWELLFGVQLWNYGNLPFHVTQYAGLVPTLGYGGGAFLIFRFAYKPLIDLIRSKVNYRAAKIVCSTLGIAIVLDTIFMGIQIAVFHQPPVYWSVRVW